MSWRLWRIRRRTTIRFGATVCAESSEVRSFINYRLSISRHERAKGTLLDHWVDKLDPRVRRALDRQAFAPGE